MEKLKLTWKDADANVDWIQPLSPLPIRPRGATDPSGGHLQTAEFISLMSKGACLLAGGTAPESDEVVGSLPSWDEHIAMTNARYARQALCFVGLRCSESVVDLRSLPFSYWNHTGGDHMSLAIVIALLHEKFGSVDDALAWGDRIATLEDVAAGGSNCITTRTRGLCLKGRCLASQGKMAEAEEALSTAAEQIAGVGFYLLEVLALRDLLVHVLRKTDREGEGMARLKVAVVRLMRPEPAQEDLDVLASSLGEEVELSAVLQWDA